VTAHAPPTVHPDHRAEPGRCERLEIPFWCPELDVPAAENPKLIDRATAGNSWHFIRADFTALATGSTAIEGWR